MRRGLSTAHTPQTSLCFFPETLARGMISSRHAVGELSQRLGSSRLRGADISAAEAIVYITLAALSGCTAAVQSGTNLSLSLHVHYPAAHHTSRHRAGGRYSSSIAAGLISFIGGVCVLLALNVVLCISSFRGANQVSRPKKLYHWFGGIFGSSALMMLLISNAHVGYATTSVLRLAGNLATAALFDHIGILGYKKRECDCQNFVLLCVVALGCSLSALARGRCSGDEWHAYGPRWQTVVISTLALWAGCSQPVQASLNTQLAIALGAKLRATLASFIGGSLCLLAQLVLIEGFRAPSFDDQIKPWMFLGGAYGAFIVSMNVLLPPKIGLATSFTLQIVANVVFSCFLDAIGFAIDRPRKPTTLRLFGVCLTLAAAVLVTYLKTKAGLSTDSRRGAKAALALPVFHESSASPLYPCKALTVAKDGFHSYFSLSSAEYSDLNSLPASINDDDHDDDAASVTAFDDN